MSTETKTPPIPKKAMVVFAHPDDPDFSIAGTAAVWTQAGAEVIYVLITDGNSGSHEQGMTKERLATIRRDEQRAAAHECGVEEVVFLGYDDGLLQPTLELRRELIRVIRQYQPDVLVCGDPTAFFYGNSYINHPDHRAAAVAALEAVFPAAAMPLVFPELQAAGYLAHRVREVWVTDSVKADTYVDISQVMGRKVAALRQHKSQMEDWDPTEMVTNWAKEAGEKAGLPAAESYRRMILVNDETTQPIAAAVGTPEAAQPANVLHTSYGEVNLDHCHPMLREEIALVGDADPFELQWQTPSRLRARLKGVEERALTWRPADGEWSIKEVLAHFVVTEIVYGYRYRAIVANPGAAIPGYDQEAWAARLPEATYEAEALLEQLEALKRINVTFLRSLTPAQRAVWGLHGERGAESIAALIGAIAGHDIIHENQLAEKVTLWRNRSATASIEPPQTGGQG